MIAHDMYIHKPTRGRRRLNMRPCCIWAQLARAGDTGELTPMLKLTKQSKLDLDLTATLILHLHPVIPHPGLLITRERSIDHQCRLRRSDKKSFLLTLTCQLLQIRSESWVIAHRMEGHLAREGRALQAASEQVRKESRGIVGCHLLVVERCAEQHAAPHIPSRPYCCSCACLHARILPS